MVESLRDAANEADRGALPSLVWVGACGPGSPKDGHSSTRRTTPEGGECQKHGQFHAGMSDELLHQPALPPGDARWCLQTVDICKSQYFNTSRRCGKASTIAFLSLVQPVRDAL